jgi:hypothetical protein
VTPSAEEEIVCFNIDFFALRTGVNA